MVAVFPRHNNYDETAISYFLLYPREKESSLEYNNAWWWKIGEFP